MLAPDGLDSCLLLVDYCDVFISCLDSDSDGTHSLQRMHWWASDVMLNFSRSVQMKKRTHLHPKGEFFFCNVYKKISSWKSSTNVYWLNAEHSMVFVMLCLWTCPFMLSGSDVVSDAVTSAMSVIRRSKCWSHSF